MIFYRRQKDVIWEQKKIRQKQILIQKTCFLCLTPDFPDSAWCSSLLLIAVWICTCIFTFSFTLDWRVLGMKKRILVDRRTLYSEKEMQKKQSSFPSMSLFHQQPQDLAPTTWIICSYGADLESIKMDFFPYWDSILNVNHHFCIISTFN